MDAKKKALADDSARRAILNANRETMANSTVHGLSSISRTQHTAVKVLWVLCIIGSGSYCAYTIYDCFAQYFQFRVVTQIEIKYVNQLIFPVVKVCRSDLGIPDNKERTIEDKESMLQNTIFLQNTLKSGSLVAQKTYGISNLSDILYTCIYNFNYCNLTADFDYYYDYNYGSCYRFNSGKNMVGEVVPFKFAAQTGGLNGLQMEFFVGQASQNDNLYSFDNGFNILISNESLDSSTKEGIRLTAGYATDISLSQYSISLQPKPYSTCVGDLTKENSYDSICYKKTWASAVNQSRLYHFTDCSFMCFQRYLGGICKCQDLINDAFYPEMRKCTDYQDVKCIYSTMTSYSSKPEILIECDCPLECEKTDYSLTTSYLQYPTKYYSSILTSNPLIKQKFGNTTSIDFTALQQSVIACAIFYDELKQTQVSHEVKILASDLLALIGGNLGLFLGMSLLTFVEGLEAFVQSLIIFFKFKKSANRKIHANPAAPGTKLFVVNEGMTPIEKR